MSKTPKASQQDDTPQSLTRRVLFAYGFPAFPLAALTLPVYIFLPTFYAKNMGLGLATVGLVLMIARIWDVISDPVVGLLSDATKTRFGRRTPWIIAGLPLVMLSTWILLVPPHDAGVLTLLLGSLVLYTGWSLMNLPLYAWGAELSDNYNERTRVMSWREGLTVAGLLSVLGLIALTGNDDPAGGLKVIALLVMILLPVSLAGLLIFVREPARRTEPKISFQNGIRAIRDNAPFKRLIAAYLLNGLANGLPATLFLLYAEYGVGRADLGGAFLFVYFLCGVLSVPVWSLASKKYGKHSTWCFAMLLTCGFFLMVPFVAQGDVILFALICVLTGAGLGADLVLPSAMQADVVDMDRLETGKRRTGLYFAMWGMTTKLALALAAGVAFPLLAVSGFDADGGGNRDALIALYALLPVALKCFAIALMWRYPLTQSVTEDLHKKIKKRWKK